MQYPEQKDATQAHPKKNPIDGPGFTEPGRKTKEEVWDMFCSGKSVVRLIVVAGLSAMCWAAEDNPNPGRPQTITGCLSKGTGAGEFVLTDEGSGAKIIVKGSAELDKHAANHKVKLTGTQTMEESKQVFKVTEVEHISDVCTPAR